MKTKNDTNDRFVIIMAGGRGERFWPLSREKMPKQLLALLGRKSFLQEAVGRVLPLVPAKNIFVITNEAQLPEVRKQLPKIPKDNLVAEPIGRDTCAAVTLGAALVGARSTTGVMAVLPADHVIPDEKKFQQVLSDAFDVAAQGQAIVTIGIKPTEPATGYGYIHTGAELPTPPGAKKTRTTFFKAERFVEKPDFQKALEYVNSGAVSLERRDVRLELHHRHERTGDAPAGNVRRVPALVQGCQQSRQALQSAGEGISRHQKNLD